MILNLKYGINQFGKYKYSDHYASESILRKSLGSVLKITKIPNPSRQRNRFALNKFTVIQQKQSLSETEVIFQALTIDPKSNNDRSKHLL